MENVIVGLLIIVGVLLAALYQRSLRQPHAPVVEEKRPPLWW